MDAVKYLSHSISLIIIPQHYEQDWMCEQNHRPDPYNLEFLQKLS